MRNDSVARKLNSLLLCGLVLMALVLTIVGTVSSESIQWMATIHCDESSGKHTYIVVGEATDALDGQDTYDAPLPPPGFPPTLTLFIETGFSYPRNTLMREIRHYPGESQVWKLVAEWSGDETTVVLSWSIPEFLKSDYTSILLTGPTQEDTLVDMLSEDTYSFMLTDGISQIFYILCSEPSFDEEPEEDNETPTEPDEEPDTNQPPTADASASETEGYIDTPVHFDGSLSTDEDGTVIQWEWDFGDGSLGTGSHVTHSYAESGFYVVTLTVTDDESESDDDIMYLRILEKNGSVMRPYLQGPDKGTKHTIYSFSLWATASSHDSIVYTITWGDDTNTTTSPQSSGELVTVNHSWEIPGIYYITAMAQINQSFSNQTNMMICIDTLLLENLGWLTDDNADQIYDTFTDEHTNLSTSLSVVNQSVYLIDTNGDGTWEYRYDASLELLQTYTDDDSSPVTTTPSNYLGCVLILLGVLAFLLHHRTRRHT